MGVSIIPGNVRTSSDLFGQQIAQAMGQYLPGAIQRGQDAARQNQQEQKLKQQQQAENEAAKRLGIDLYGFTDPKIRQQLVSSGYENEVRNKQLQDIFGKDYKSPYAAPGSGDQNPNQAQNIPDLTNIPDEALARLSLVDPQRANALRHVISIQRQQKGDKQRADLEGVSNTKFSEGYQALQGDDMDAFSKIMKDPQTPYEVKSRLSNLKNQQDVRKDVRAREIRTRRNFLMTAYDRAIKAERDLLAKATYKDNKPEIEKRIENLRKSHKRDMKKFTEDPESYPQLSIWSNAASEYLPEQELENGMMGAEGQGYEGQPNQGQRVQFNSQNPEHRSRAEQLFKQYKDKEKVRQILSREFEGL